MLQYLVILLDDTATSFCHYAIPMRKRRLMPLETLRKAILFAMKENLNVQFVYPDYELPAEYIALIDTIDHTDICPCRGPMIGDVNVAESWDELSASSLVAASTYVLRTCRAEFVERYAELKSILSHVARLNVVLTDVETFAEADYAAYKTALQSVSKDVERLYIDGSSPQLNLLTDRMMLKSMNNCDAGDTTLTLAPNGQFYICPAFYYEPNDNNVGTLENGPIVKNAQLYRLDHAPICRKCDAYQCRRCVWLNYSTTLEVNTPSREQCVTAHLERNASRELLNEIRRHGTFLSSNEDITEIDYLDPFDIVEK